MDVPLLWLDCLILFADEIILTEDQNMKRVQLRDILVIIELGSKVEN